MNTKINFQVLNIVNQDSGALGPLGMIIHQFPEPGHYRVAIQRGGRTVADTAFHVDPGAGAQINIDLAAAARRNPRHGDCECKTETANPPQVSPKGYVLFHASALPAPRAWSSASRTPRASSSPARVPAMPVTVNPSSSGANPSLQNRLI